jgi:predicted AlkP superfamily pyrophosphatase or phosphodiesterase
MTKPRVFSLFASAALLLGQMLSGAPVLMISIDGLRPDYLTHADEHGLKIPNLRRFLKEGAYAEGVRGVVPSITYPSHTTLVTGVWPAQHGILANTTFDPLNENLAGWYWYAKDIKVPTLWQAADQAGMVTASLNWPASVAAKGVRYLVPEYWRAHTPDDRELLEALTRPEGWLEELEQKLGPYTNGNETSVRGDGVRTRFAVEILAAKKPAFMTIHLTALDEAQHESSPFSADSNAALEALDGMIGQLRAAAVANDPNAVVAVVSDHGFARTDVRVNLMIPFVEQGFVKTGEHGSWDAAPWPAGGGIAVMLHHPEDATMRARVKEMLKKLAGNPDYGIARILEADELKKLGGFPDAAFFVELKPGYSLGAALAGPMTAKAPSTGTHGYMPDRPEMLASFFVAGRGIAEKSLGVIDMRQVAPTVAMILGVKFPSATLPGIDLGVKH